MTLSSHTGSDPRVDMRAYLIEQHRARRRRFAAQAIKATERRLAKPRARLDLDAKIYNEPIGPIRARHYLHVSSQFEAPSARILREICEQYGIEKQLILSQKRSRYIAKPRIHAYYRMFHETDLSMVQIGRIMGRDHTTILNGIRSHEQSITGVSHPYIARNRERARAKLVAMRAANPSPTGTCAEA